MDRRSIILIVVAILTTGCRGGKVSVAPETDTEPARMALIPTFTPLPPATATFTPIPTATPTVPYYTPTPDQWELAGLPVRLEIPAIGVDAVVEHVGRLPGGQMDVPKVPDNVAWFVESPRPGQESTNASIVSGHLDSPIGPAVFYKLRTLVLGDEMVVTYENGDRYVFTVVEKERYYYDNPPYQKLYGDGESVGRSLNLITCDGAWDRGQANYQQRLVVYSELVEDEGAPSPMSVPTPSVTPISRPGP